MGRRFTRSSISLAAASLLFCLSATAQDAATPDATEPLPTIPVDSGDQPQPLPATTADDDQQGLAEIIVTAQKRVQSLHDVPLSVTAVGADQLHDINASDLTDVALYVPNARVDTDDLGSPQVFIRGFGTNTFNPSFESSVGFVEDDIFYARGAYFTEAMFDIDRVEVLRGPQGTLFGKNTVAGLYNVISKGPTDTLSADGRLSYAEDNEKRFEGGVGGMFNDSFGARVSVLAQARDGDLENEYLDRDENKMNQKAARIKLRYLPVDDVQMDLNLVRSDTSINFWPYELFNLDNGTRQYLHSFDPNLDEDPYDFKTSFDAPGFIDKGSSTESLKTDWTIGDLGPIHDAHAVLVGGYSKLYINQLNDLDVSPADLLRLVNHEHYHQTSVELRFNGRADSLFGLGKSVDFVTGGYYFTSDYQLLAQIKAGKDLGSYLLTRDFAQLATGNLNAPPLTLIDLPGFPILGSLLSPVIGDDYYQFDYAQNVKSAAFFTQFTWNLSDHWALTPGVRVNHETKTIDTAGTGCPAKGAASSICVTSLLLGANDYDVPGKRDETDISPKVALQYIWDENLNFYTSYARGYKSGGYNSLSYTGTDLTFKPEKAATTEVGFKSRFFHHTLNFNTTLYYTTLDNLQVLAFHGATTNVGNASATSKGLESDFQWLTPWRLLTINGSFGLLHATYDSYPDAPAPIANGINATQDLKGRRIAFAPKQTATITPILTVPMPWDLAVRIAGDAIFQGDQYTDTDLDPHTHVGGYWQYAARVSVGDQNDDWSLTLGGSNLGDKRVLNQVTDAVLFPGSYYAQQAPGRQLYAALTLHW
ncbi:TonB-dependent receptor [Solimonas terrae]|uniref:TonB-dependent receptor n=1 Tax=Solimonas terrae TaxID=1396819 RepID=A0A6M2BNF3_9GAMM|nr:TonB-dependent receptor [Solimonas terrae]NGY04172.1 TonB-dependent receptor [Solimonas terrae]